MKNYDKRRDELFSRFVPVICLLSACFLLGAVLGSFFAAELPQDAVQYVEVYAERVSDGSGTALFKAAFWPAFVMLALVFFAGFGRLGGLVIPAVFIVRGFSMSLGITAFVRTYGLPGYLPAIAAELLSGFVITGCLFVFSLMTFSTCTGAGRRVGAYRRTYDTGYYMAAAVCLAIIMLAALLYAYLVPPLARAAFLIIS